MRGSAGQCGGAKIMVLSGVLSARLSPSRRLADGKKYPDQYSVEMEHTAAQPTQQASRQINSLLMTLHSCYLLSIDDNFPIETRHSKDLLLKPMHSRLKINI